MLLNVLVFGTIYKDNFFMDKTFFIHIFPKILKYFKNKIIYSFKHHSITKVLEFGTIYKEDSGPVFLICRFVDRSCSQYRGINCTLQNNIRFHIFSFVSVIFEVLIRHQCCLIHLLNE